MRIAPRALSLRSPRPAVGWISYLALVLVLFTARADAYEGAGLTDEPEEPAPAPQLTRPPEVKRFVEAAYPPEALAEGRGGDVVLQIDIEADGTVSRAEVVGSAGVEFDEAAREALLQFEFIPAEIDHVPATVRLEYLYRFEPRPPAPAQPEEPAEQPINLRGRVLQRGTREPLVGATVYLPETGEVTETGPDGRFEIRGAPTGTVKIEVAELNHKKFVTEEEIREGEVTELTAYLWKRLESGFEATVRAERERKEVTRRTLQREELTSVPGTFGDPVRVIENLPGMARAPYVGGLLLLRGANPQDTGVLIDGVPIPLLYHFGGGRSVVNPSFIDRIDFYPGAYSARYGRAIAGVVDVASRRPKPRRVRGSFDIDALDAGGYLESPVAGGEWGSFAISGRRSYVDAFLPTILEATRQPGQAAIVAAPRYWDYQARYDFDWGHNHFEAVAFGSNDFLVAAQAGDVETEGFSLRTQQGFHRLRLAWSRKTPDGWEFSLAPTIGTTLQTFDFNQQISGDIRQFDVNTRGFARKEISKALTLETGIDLNSADYSVGFDVPILPNYQTFPGENPQLGNQKVTANARLSSWAGYVESVWSPLSGTKLIPGLRMELYDLPRRIVPSLEPRFAIRQDVADGTTLKAAWGLFRQAPQPQELEADFGNPYLDLLRSSQYVVGIEQRLPARFSVDLQAFYNQRRNLVVSSDAIVERDGRQVREGLSNAGVGSSYGLEFLLKQELTERSYGWIAYTLSRSQQVDQRTGENVPMWFDQTHILTAVASYKLPGGWEIGSRFRLTTGRPMTPIIGATFDADTGNFRSVTGDVGSVRGVTFHQLDVRVEKLWTFRTWRMSSYLDVQNLYNAENPEFLIYDYRFRETAPVRGLPFLPTAGVRGSF